MTHVTMQFREPTNPEESPIKKERNLAEFANLSSEILNRSRDSTIVKLVLLGRQREEGARLKVYDDDLVKTVSEEFTDRLRAFFVIGDAIRAFRGSLHRNEINADDFIKIALNKIVSRGHIFREDTARVTKVAPLIGNIQVPFMNGAPAGENWNHASNGFYDWIDNKSQESIERRK
jgi:hypothetical protein